MEQNPSRTQSHSQSLGHLYRSELNNILGQLEKQRRAIFKQAGINALWTLGGIVVGLAISNLLGLGVGLWIILGGIVVWFALLTEPIDRYRKNFKEQIIQRLVKLYDPSLSYNPTGGISQQEFEKSRIFRQSVDRYAAEDLIYGLLGKTAARFSEVKAEYKTTRTDSQGREEVEWHLIFKGIFFIADFNKHFQGMTFIYPDHLESEWGGLGSWFESLTAKKQKIGSTRCELVKLEDPKFERLFAVYSTDQVEARYILSTSLMQRLVEFHDRVGKPVTISFIDSKVHIAIPNDKNLFEPPWFKSAMMTLAEVEAYFNDVKLAAAIVEDLNLNRRIWTKQ